MTTQPLDLLSRLRPAPRSLDAWFLANVGLLALFFLLFGSRFVLAPGLGVEFDLPSIAGARVAAKTTTHQITVRRSGQILADDGIVTIKQLAEWLKREKASTPHPTLLVLASVGVPSNGLAEIVSVAQTAGYAVVWGALEPPAPERRTSP